MTPLQTAIAIAKVSLQRAEKSHVPSHGHLVTHCCASVVLEAGHAPLGEHSGLAG